MAKRLRQSNLLHLRMDIVRKVCARFVPTGKQRL